MRASAAASCSGRAAAPVPSAACSCSGRPTLLRPALPAARPRVVTTATPPERSGIGEPQRPPSLVEVEDGPAEAQRAPGPSSVPYPAVAALAGVGAAETAYLTWAKLAGAGVACPLSGCDVVLSSSYSELFGVPLSLLGLLAYGAVAATALAAAKQPSQAQRTLNTGLSAGVSLLAGVSGFLIYLLQTEFSGQPCAWCYLSATLSLALAGTLAVSLPPRQLQQAAAPSLGSLACAVLVLYFGTGSVGSSTASSNFELPFEPPQVTTSSSGRAMAVAERLKQAGARMYGAFWCSHCFDQKQEFGAQAMAAFPYVECFPDGWKRGTPEARLCEEAGVRAFPTWVINGKTVEGQLTLDELEKELGGAGSGVPAAAAAP